MIQSMDVTKAKTATLPMVNLSCEPSIKHLREVVSEVEEENDKFEVEVFEIICIISV